MRLNGVNGGKTGRIVRHHGEYVRVRRCPYCYKLTDIYGSVCKECVDKRDKARDDFFKFVFKRRDLYAS